MNPTPTPNSPAPVDIARLRELLAKATPEMWYCPNGDSALVFSSYVKGVLGTVTKKEDADLIAALRNDAPALLDEVTQLREQVKCLVHNWQGQITRTNAERDKLREEVALERQATRVAGAIIGEVEKRLGVDANGNPHVLYSAVDSLRQQNEQLLKEIEELRARPTGIWKESQ